MTDQTTEDARISDAAKTDPSAAIAEEVTDAESSPEELEGSQQDPADGNQESLNTEGDTFPRAYVEQLRQENGKYRQDARDAGQRADALAQRLHAALVAADGRLQDPSDLQFDEAHLADDGALAQAIEDLLARKPHLAARKVTGDVGQGSRNGTGAVDLLGMLRGH